VIFDETPILKHMESYIEYPTDPMESDDSESGDLTNGARKI
jgi:hypothetical protein